MKKLVVFDFDKTLIDHDSFKALIKKNLLINPYLIKLICLRFFNKISRKEFAKSSHQKIESVLSDNVYVSKFIKSTLRSVNKDVYRKFKDLKQEEVYILLLSASPNEYISEIGKILGFDSALGSFFEEEKYIHMYGNEKLTYLKSNYPKMHWDWFYAISDSHSDVLLLKSFKKFDLI